jgi:hypothetical protein
MSDKSQKLRLHAPTAILASAHRTIPTPAGKIRTSMGRYSALAAGMASGTLWHDAIVNYAKKFLALLLLVVSVAFGCARSMEGMREAPDPPSFAHLSDDEVSTAMGRLAQEVVQLDAALQVTEATRRQYNDSLLKILRSMRSSAASLSKAGETNHPRIDRFLPTLIDDIDHAISAAENLSENYYYAGAVIGACEYCHLPRHQPRSTNAGS